MTKVVTNTSLSVNKYKYIKIENPCENIASNLKSHVTISVKIEKTHDAPNLEDNLQNCCNTNYENENINSPLLNEIKLQDLTIVRQENLQESDNIVQTSVCLESKRKLSTSSDYDTLKSGLYMEHDNEENNFEDIEFKYELDSLMYFDNDMITMKISSDMPSSMLDVNNIQKTDDPIGINNKDSFTDLFISDHEEKNTGTTRMDLKSKSPLQKRRSEHIKNKQAKTNNVEQELPLDFIKKLQTLQIKLIHEVPPQHKIELTGAHAPSIKDKRLFQRHGPLRKGPYSPTEDKIIRQNWKTFCKLHDWDSKNVKPFLIWRHKGKYYIEQLEERRKFVQFLANGLKWRTLYSVHSRFKTLYNKTKIINTRYTSKEDKQILMYMQDKCLDNCNTKFQELADLLCRTKRSIYKRYKYLKAIENGSEEKTVKDVKWTLPLIKKFIQILLNLTLSEDIRELKCAIIPKPVWKKMEKKLNIDNNVLKTFWQHQLHMQLFSTGPIYLNDIKIILIEYMYGKGISNTREIIWPSVAQYFDGATPAFLCKVFFYLVQECNMYDMDNFSDIVEYLYSIKIEEIKNAPSDKFLPRIRYKNGKIRILDTDNTIRKITTDTENNTDDWETDCDTDY